MIIKGKDANKKKAGVMNIREYNINSDFSGALIEINGDHGALKCLKEDRIYTQKCQYSNLKVGDMDISGRTLP